MGVVEVCVDVLVDGLQRLAERDWCRRCVCRDEWSQDPVVNLCVEDRDALPVGGEGVGVAVLPAPDQAVGAEPGEVVTHLVCAVVSAE